MGEKKRHLKEKMQNFDKIRLIRVQMTSRNAEFHGELKEIRFKIQIEMKMRGKNAF